MCKFSVDDSAGLGMHGRNMHFVNLVHHMLAVYRVPDVIFIFYEADIPPLQYSGGIPLFSFSAFADSRVLTLPYYMFSSSGQDVLAQTIFRHDTIPFSERKPFAVWGGTVKRSGVDNSFARQTFVRLAQRRRQMFRRMSPPSYSAQVQNKYIVGLDGAGGWHWGLAYNLLMRSVTIHQEHVTHSWFTRSMVPHVHFVPVKRNLQNLTTVVKHLRLNDYKAENIGMEGHKFAKKYLSVLPTLAYMARILIILSGKQQGVADFVRTKYDGVVCPMCGAVPVYSKDFLAGKRWCSKHIGNFDKGGLQRFPGFYSSSD